MTASRECQPGPCGPGRGGPQLVPTRGGGQKIVRLHIMGNGTAVWSTKARFLKQH